MYQDTCPFDHLHRNWGETENNNVATLRNFERFFLLRSMHSSPTITGPFKKEVEAIYLYSFLFKRKCDNTLCRSLPQSPFLIIILWVVVLIFLSDITVTLDLKGGFSPRRTFFDQIHKRNGHYPCFWFYPIWLPKFFLEFLFGPQLETAKKFGLEVRHQFWP